MPTWASVELKRGRAEKADQHEANTEYLNKSEQTYLKLAQKRNSTIIECTRGQNILTIEKISQNLCNFVKNWLKNN